MLSFFSAEDLPSQPPTRPRESRSVTRFRDIFAAGQFVYENCIQYGHPPQPGWNNAGKAQMAVERAYWHLLLIAVRSPSQYRYLFLDNQLRNGQSYIWRPLLQRFAGNMEYKHRSRHCLAVIGALSNHSEFNTALVLRMRIPIWP